MEYILIADDNKDITDILKLWPRRMVRLDWNVHVRMMLI